MSRVTIEELNAHLETLEDALRAQGIKVDEAEDDEDDGEGLKCVRKGTRKISWGMVKTEGSLLEILILFTKGGDDPLYLGGEPNEELNEIYWSLTGNIFVSTGRTDGSEDGFFEDHVLKAWIPAIIKKFWR